MTRSKDSSNKMDSIKINVKFRQQFYDIKSTVQELIEEINYLKLKLKTTKNYVRLIFCFDYFNVN